VRADTFTSSEGEHILVIERDDHIGSDQAQGLTDGLDVSKEQRIKFCHVCGKGSD
jgi:hypothetical protein